MLLLIKSPLQYAFVKAVVRALHTYCYRSIVCANTCCFYIAYDFFFVVCIKHRDQNCLNEKKN